MQVVLSALPARRAFSVFKITDMKADNKNSFVPFLREDLNDLHAGKLSVNEYDLYVRMRHGANPYAIAKISLEGLSGDFVHRGWKKNYINKLLLALKRKGYIHYEERSGRRGTFDVHFRGFFLPNRTVSTLPQAIQADDKPDISKNSDKRSEARQSLSIPSQRLEEIKDSSQALVRKFAISDGRASYNDTENENKNKRQSYPQKRKALVTDFTPTTHSEHRCKEIAVALGEQTIDFLLGTLHKHGFLLIDQAWREYERADKTNILNKGAYFNKIVQTLIEAKNSSP
jgi:hypothetical protein